MVASPTGYGGVQKRGGVKNGVTLPPTQKAVLREGNAREDMANGFANRWLWALMPGWKRHDGFEKVDSGQIVDKASPASPKLASTIPMGCNVKADRNVSSKQP